LIFSGLTAAGSCVASLVASCLASLACNCVCSCCKKLNSCCDSKDSGRKQSVVLLGFAIALALFFEYVVAPYLDESDGLDEAIVDAWNDGCEDEAEDLQDICRGNSGVYRVSFVSFIFFVVAAAISKKNPSFNNKYWLYKYIVFLLMVFITIWINNHIFSDVFLSFARFGGFLFILLEQLILIDVAYQCNDDLVERSNQAELEERGTGNKLLKVILCSCAIIFIAVLVFIIILFKSFDCTFGNTIISFTLIFIVVTTLLQLKGEEGSLMTSGIISLYSCYLCFSALSKNPDSDCNPFLGSSNTFDILSGIFLSFVTLVWTGYAMTAEKRLSAVGMTSNSIRVDTEYDINLPLIDGDGDDDGGAVTGIPLPLNMEHGNALPLNVKDENAFPSKDKDDRSIYSKGSRATGSTAAITTESDDGSNDEVHSDVWKLNMVLVLLSCWIAVSLTKWGVIEEGDGEASDPQAGHTSCWMIIVSQWVGFLLYAWTLIAPRLFPDRDYD